MEITFKEAQTYDIALLVPMVQEFYALEQIAFHEQTIQSALAHFISNHQFGRAWLIYDNEELAGYMILTFGFCLEFGGRDAFIDEVYLKEPYRNRGIGQKAIDFLSDFGKENNIKVMLLEVGHENGQAQGFYKKTGFTAREKYFLMTKLL